MHNNIYVLDTTVLIDNPEVIYDLNGLIAVPITVIRQLDGLKKSADTDIALKARRASRVLDEITAKGNPIAGIIMPNGSIFKLTRKYTPIDTLDNIADNKIIGTAEALKKEATNNANVILLTTDVNMRIAARERGIEVKGEKIKKTISTTKKGKNNNINHIMLYKIYKIWKNFLFIFAFFFFLIIFIRLFLL